MRELRLVRKFGKKPPPLAPLDLNVSPARDSGGFAATMLRGDSLSTLASEGRTPDVTFTTTSSVGSSPEESGGGALRGGPGLVPIVLGQQGDAMSSAGSMSFVFPEGDDLLASPILLDVIDEAKKRALRDELDKRGSALVMSDQLDDLERSELRFEGQSTRAL